MYQYNRKTRKVTYLQNVINEEGERNWETKNIST
jgi:hypothetical protein